jgi:hypothetical protein
MDYRRIVEILRTSGFRGYLNVEYEEKADPFVAVPAFIKELQDAVGSKPGG